MEAMPSKSAQNRYGRKAIASVTLAAIGVAVFMAISPLVESALDTSQPPTWAINLQYFVFPLLLLFIVSAFVAGAVFTVVWAALLPFQKNK